MASAQLTPPLPDSGPYVGPRPIETGEPIFGREREIPDLYYKLCAERIVLLHSPSGAGKSSLLQAGLIPRMREEFDVWRPTRVNTPRPDEVSKEVNRYVLSAALGFEQGVPETLRRPVREIARQSLAGYVESRPRRPGAPENLLLIFDQFEEILTIDPLQLAAKQAFFDELGALLRDRRIWALVAMREDYLGAFAPYAERVPTHLQNRFRIDRLVREKAAEAIAKPARAGGRPFAPEALERLVKDLARVRIQQPDGSFKDGEGIYVEPLQLQVVCSGMWKAMPAEATEISIDTVEKFGNVSGALANYYDREVQDIAGKDKRVERDIREWVGTELILTGGIRGQVLKDKDRTKGLDNGLIAGLEDSHLIRGEQRAGATWFELAHDRLIEPVQNSNREWLKKNLEPVEEVAAVWEKQGHPGGLLFLGEDLEKARQWAAGNPNAKPRETDFIKASEEQQQRLRRERRRSIVLRWALAASLAGLVAAAGGIVYAIHETKKAEIAKTVAEGATSEAERQRKEAEGKGKEAATERDKADAQRKRALVATGEAAMQAMLANKGRADSAIANSGYVLNPQLYRYRMDLAGAYLASALRADPNSKIARYWLSNLLLYGSWTIPGKITAHADPGGTIHFSADGRIALIQSNNMSAEIRDTVTQATVSKLGLRDFVSEAWFSPSRDFVLIRFRRTPPQLWKTVGKEPRGVNILRGPGPVGAPMQYAVFSRTGKFLVTSSEMSAGANELWQVDIGNGSVKSRPLGADPPFVAAAFSPDEKTLVGSTRVDSRSGYTKVWRTADAQEVGPTVDYGSTIAFNAKGGNFVTTNHTDVKVWDAVSHKQMNRTLSLNEKATGATFSEINPDWILASAYDGSVRVWDYKLGQDVALLLHDSPVYFAEDYSDGSANGIVSARTANYVQLWGITKGGGAGPLGSPVWDPLPLHASTLVDGEFVITASGAGTELGVARHWVSPDNYYPDPRPSGFDCKVRLAGLSADGTRAFGVCSGENSIRLVDARTGKSLAKPIQEEFQAISADLNQVLTTNASHTALELRDTLSGALKAEIKGKGRIRSGGLAGNVVAALSEELTLRDVAVGKNLPTIPVDPAGIYTRARAAAQFATAKGVAAVLSGDGRSLLTVFYAGQIKIYDTHTGKEIHDETNGQQPENFVFSPDGRRVVTWANQSVWIYGLDRGARRVLVTVRGTVSLAALSRDGKRLITSTTDGTAEIWDAATARSVSGPMALDAAITGIAFSPDGLLAATIYAAKIQLWDVQAGKRIGQSMSSGFDAQGQGAPNLINAAFSPDGALLYTFNEKGGIVAWPTLVGSKSSGELLARLAEAVAGSEVSKDGMLRTMSNGDLEQRKESLRKDPELKKDVELRKHFVRLLDPPADEKN